MKKILLLIFALVMFSCSNKPDDIINDTKTEQGAWVIKPGATKPELSQDTYYQISPTWGQAFHYAKERKDHTLVTVFGIIFLVAFAVVFYGRSTDASWLPKFLDNSIGAGFAMFVLIVSGFYFLIGDASSIKWNNDKWVKKEVYDQAIKEAGSTQPIWDSLETHNLIVDGPYK